ncbi:MAG: response regulator [Elusimicrobiales bacterium]
MSDGLTILIAEDDDGHARLIQERFESVGVLNPIKRFKDGDEAWAFLSGQDGLVAGGEYLLLLDIRMPGLDGVEVLRRMKSDDRLRHIPVIMLTTTDDPREIENCYKLGCNNYLTKPVGFERFAEVVRRLGLFLMVMRVDKFK